MADLATFNVSGTFTEAGVKVGDQTFRAWPMPEANRALFAVRVCLEYASQHCPGGICIQWHWKRRDQPDRIPVPQEGATEVHRTQFSGERPIYAEGNRRVGPEWLGRSRGAFCQD